MTSIREWLKKAETVARERLGEEWVEEGRRVGSQLWQRSPDAVRRTVERLATDLLDRGADTPSGESSDLNEERGHAAGFGAPSRDSSNVSTTENGSHTSDGAASRAAGPMPSSGQASTQASNAAAATQEPRPDDATVVIYCTTETGEIAERIRDVFRRREVYVRLVNLASHPHMARQIAQETEVFVAPYVYIRGRFWGAENEVVALDESGELDVVLRGDLDALSDEARRIGRVRGTFSADLTEDNILDRLRRGHILTVDDLDCWYEGDGAEPKFFYQGGPHPVDEMPAVAQEIARAAAADEIQCQWHLEPVVHVG